MVLRRASLDGSSHCLSDFGKLSFHTIFYLSFPHQKQIQDKTPTQMASAFSVGKAVVSDTIRSLCQTLISTNWLRGKKTEHFRQREVLVKAVPFKREL